ncbi:hypothetical protein K2173_022125 [Erythroxylum novogranatense]|uniref:Pentatricopeptide repeat-containing protein n=1 Tax=Erythroxylum novogranatense TaxID=1862640 RepID=A0AAV8STE1_9ROSI|nr:hypothetical protein K2173_022125 [Erythroxylum novogranatense]
MSNVLFRILKETHKFTSTANVFTKATTARNNLYSRVSPLGDPRISVIPVLDKWVEEGRKVKAHDLQRLVKSLRSGRRYKQALEVSEWMSNKELGKFSLADRAIQLDLIGRVRGLEFAENYIENMDDEEKIDKIYGALLNCYVREGLVDKALSIMQKIKELGFAGTTLNYNDLMCLYTRTGQFEKVPDILSEMKENNVTPDNFSYRICMNAYATTNDLDNVEIILKEMESQPSISMDWLTYATVAHIYIKVGEKQKAIGYLKKCEEIVGKDVLGYNHLISLYASLGDKDEMMRLWGLQKAKCKKQVNRDYITMLGCLVKLGEFEESEKLLEQWESSSRFYDFRVPNVLLIGYCKEGLIEKAEGMFQNWVQKQKRPIPNSWSILAAAYANKQNMEKAFECMKEALAVQEENVWWRPKAELISNILSWLGDNGDIEEVEAFVSSLESKFPKNREMYHTMVKAYDRVGKEVNVLAADKEADGDEEAKMKL